MQNKNIYTNRFSISREQNLFFRWNFMQRDSIFVSIDMRAGSLSFLLLIFFLARQTHRIFISVFFTFHVWMYQNKKQKTRKICKEKVKKKSVGCFRAKKMQIYWWAHDYRLEICKSIFFTKEHSFLTYKNHQQSCKSSNMRHPTRQWMRHKLWLLQS